MSESRQDSKDKRRTRCSSLCLPSIMAELPFSLSWRTFMGSKIGTQITDLLSILLLLLILSPISESNQCGSSSSKLLIKGGGIVVNAHHQEIAEDGIMVTVQPHIKVVDDVTVLDASGKYVMPGSCSKSKKTRDPNRLRGLSNQQRQVVSFNEYGQPVGDIGKQLASYIDILAREGQLAPIDCLDWRKMPNEKKERMWEVVLTRFDVNPEKEKNWVMAKLANSWRNWKNELKRKCYDPFESAKEQLQHCHERVDPMQWASLLQFWGSEEGMARSRRNSANRTRQKMSHTAGTKSFARIREEHRARNPNGQAPDRIEMFRLTHTRRDGQPMDQASSDTIRELIGRIGQQPESLKSSTAQNEIFTQVMGEDKRGRVRTFGLGVTPSDIYSPQVTLFDALKIAEIERSQGIASEQRMSVMEEELHTMKRKLTELSTLQSKLVEWRTFFQRFTMFLPRIPKMIDDGVWCHSETSVV